MRLEARRTRVFTVDRDKYAPPLAGAQQRIELVFNPFECPVKRNGKNEFRRTMTRPKRCCQCGKSAAVDENGKCLKCVVDGMPPVEPAREVFE